MFKNIIKNNIRAVLEEMGVQDIGEIELETPPDDKMGDLAFPCFRLSKILKRSPAEIAEEMAEILGRDAIRRDAINRVSATRAIEKIESQGPYVNFFLMRDNFLADVLKDVLEKGEDYGKKSSVQKPVSRDPKGSKLRGEKKEKLRNSPREMKQAISRGKEIKKLRERKNPPQSPFDKRGSPLIMVEYSGPNTNKPLHLGHGRNSFLGMAVSNLLENAGFEVIKANIVNDRGIHICKSMLAYQLFGGGDSPEKSKLKGDHFVGKYYIMYGKKLKDDSSLEGKAKEMLKKWEEGDEEVLALWEKMNGWYYEGVKKTYKKIGSEFDKYYYESLTYKHGKEIVERALEKGIVYKKEDGAAAIDLSEEGLDEKILLRSDGTSVYITQDLYTAKIRFEEFDLERLIYVVASEQNYHFSVLFKILEKLGYDFAKKCYHLSYGMVNVAGGKLKSREGVKVDLDDLVEQLKNMAIDETSKKQHLPAQAGNKKTTPACAGRKQESSKTRKQKEQKLEIRPSNTAGKNWKLEFHKDSEGEKEGNKEHYNKGNALEERAMRIGLAALKFMLLRVSPEKNVSFNPEEAISFEGDTGPYVMYAYTRIKSILRKTKLEIGNWKLGNLDNGKQSGRGKIPRPSAELCRGTTPFKKGGDSIDISDEEMRLAKLIQNFPEILEKAADDLNPAIVANYLLNIAGTFNQFYHIHKVIDAETEDLRDMRIALIKAVAVVLERGMGILGIEMVEEM